MMFGLTYEADMRQAANEAKDGPSARRAVALVQHRWLSDDPVPLGEVREQDNGRPQFRDPAAKFARG